MESDSATLVSALLSNDYEMADFGVLLQEARSLCILNFDCCEFHFCPQKCNKVADALAALVFGRVYRISEWIEYSPDFVTGLVAIDSAALLV